MWVPQECSQKINNSATHTEIVADLVGLRCTFCEFRFEVSVLWVRYVHDGLWPANKMTGRCKLYACNSSPFFPIFRMQGEIILHFSQLLDIILRLPSYRVSAVNSAVFSSTENISLLRVTAFLFHARLENRSVYLPYKVVVIGLVMHGWLGPKCAESTLSLLFPVC